MSVSVLSARLRELGVNTRHHLFEPGRFGGRRMVRGFWVADVEAALDRLKPRGAWPSEV